MNPEEDKMRVELPKTIVANIERFTGRTWLLSPLLNWLARGDQRIFLLTGGPGTGKSMIMAWLAGYGPEPEDSEAQAQLRRLREQVRAVHFCMAASRSNSPLAFAENIANQLTRNVKGFGEALAATLAERVQILPTQTIGTIQSGATVTGVYIGRLDLGTLGDELSFDRAFTQPVKKLYESGYDKPLLLLADALDEAETYTGVKKLPELLAGLDDLPSQVRIVATTRPDPRILKYYRRSRPFDLIKDAPPNVDDVHAYALGRLARVEGLDAGTASALADRIAVAAKGIFLYAAIVLDELLPRLPNLPDLDLARYPLPDGLSGLYHDFLNRELGRDEDRWYETFKPVLGLIAVAQGEGLTKTQLQQITGKEVEQPLRICKQYLVGELPERPFHIFHKSLADFLLEDEDSVDYHIDAAAGHRQIADYYWKTFHTDWQRCDTYGLNNLAAHLAGAHRWDDLHLLVTEGDAEAQLWACARLATEGSYAGYMVDLSRAWTHAEGNKEVGPGIARQTHYALIASSLHSIASNIPAELLGALVRYQMPGWTPAAALGYALQVPPERRAASLVALAPYLPADLFESVVPQVLAVALALSEQFPWPRSWAIRQLAPYLSPELAREALQVAGSLGDLQVRNGTLAALAPRLPAAEVQPLLAQALADTQAIGDTQQRIAAVAALAPGLAADLQAAAMSQALVEALALPEERVRDDRVGMRETPRYAALSALAPFLPPELKPQAIAAIQQIEHEGYRTAVLVDFAPWLLPDLLRQIIDGLEPLSGPFGWTMMTQTPWNGPWDSEELVARALVRLAQQLPADLLPQAMSIALNIGRWEQRADALAALAPRLPPDSRAKALSQALTDAQRMQYRPSKIRMLTTIAPALPPDQQRQALSQALALAQTINDPGARAQALAALAAFLPGELRTQTLRAALDLARTTEWRDDPQETLAAIAPNLPPELMADCLAAACAIDRREQRGTALAALARYLPAELLGQAWSAAIAIEEQADRLQAMVGLAPCMPEERRSKAMKEAVATAGQCDGRDRADALAALAPHLPADLLPEALAVARTCEPDYVRAGALETLGSHVPAGLLPDALAAAQDIASNWGRYRALSGLLSRVPADQYQDVLGQTLAAALAIGNLSTGFR